MKWYFIIIIVFGYKLVVNTIRVLHTKLILNQYREWLKTKKWKFVQKRSVFIALMKKANVSDSLLPNVQPVGYGQIVTANISVQKNFPSDRNDLFQITFGMFYEAIGIYKKRIIETFNPIYWIELIIFLPKNILTYLSVKSESIIIKLVQIIWWIIGIIFTVLLTIYKNEIIEFIRSLLNKYFSI